MARKFLAVLVAAQAVLGCAFAKGSQEGEAIEGPGDGVAPSPGQGSGGAPVPEPARDAAPAPARDAAPAPARDAAPAPARDAAPGPARDAAPAPARDAAPGPARDAPPPMCRAARAACDDASQCCDGLSCGETTLGRVCCGNQGTSCATANGEDCCGDLLCVAGRCQPPGGEAPLFKAPFPCGQRWTYSHHSAEVRLALDFVRDDGGTTNGAPVLASAAGRASRLSEPGGAGNYIVIDHGGGWQTYYFHLSSYSVPDGAMVVGGQQVGLTGSTGASSGPHIHYEQLHGGAGQTIRIDGRSLAPYPGTYGNGSITSDNGCGGP